MFNYNDDGSNSNKMVESKKQLKSSKMNTKEFWIYYTPPDCMHYEPKIAVN